tara:strand:+ start:3188 stop:4453 length:1266 start_codon:yes stop_codon:yes gene_type:complete
MANKTINDFTAKSPLVSTDEFLIQETGGGTTKKALISTISAAITPSNQVLINAKTDFPAPIAGVITLLADTQYVIGADINLGSDVFVLQDLTCISGSESILTTLTSTSAADLFTMLDATVSINNLTIDIPNGRVFNYTDTGSRILRCKELIVNCDMWGAFISTSASNIRFNNCEGTIETDGMTFTGNFRVLLWDTSTITINNGSIWDLGTATFDSIIIDIVIATLLNGSAGLTGAVGSANINANGIGSMQRMVNSNVGVPLAGITPDDALWEFFGNDSIRDTRPDGLLSMQGNAVATVIATAGVHVLVAGVWTVEDASQFTGSTAGRLTYNGTKDIKLPIDFSCSLEPVSGGLRNLSMQVAINGAVIAGSNITVRTSSGTPTEAVPIWQATLTTGDYVEVWVANNDSTIDVLVSSAVSRVN